jgi:hypothetical protein
MIFPSKYSSFCPNARQSIGLVPDLWGEVFPDRDRPKHIEVKISKCHTAVCRGLHLVVFFTPVHLSLVPRPNPVISALL